MTIRENTVRAIPWILGAAVFLLVASTARHYGVTWDEPAYFHAADLHIQWTAEFWQNLLRGQPTASLRGEVINAAWHWDPYHVPHPPFSRILSGLTKAIFSPVMDKFVAYRLAPALSFTLLATVMYLWMTALFDRTTGIFSALTLVLIPNLFGFAHFAVTDLPLAAMWFVTVYCFWQGLKSWKWSVVLGVAWGLALATKFPAFLIPVPLLLWAHIYHRRSYANNLFTMIFLSPMVMIALNPYWWHETLPRLVTFLYDHVSRSYRPETNFLIYFFHQLYYTHDLPWYYPLFMIAVTTPEIFVVLSLVGVASIRFLREQRAVLVLFLLNVIFIPVMGLSPGAVLHDGIRQLLSVLPFIGALAGAGFFVVTRYIVERGQKMLPLNRVQHLKPKLSGSLFLLTLFLPATDLVVYHPYELSYYNRFVGGLRGAYQRGLEITYYMEAFTPDFLKLLNEKLPPHATINATVSNVIFEYYQKEGRLRPDIKFTDGKDFNYYIRLIRFSTLIKAEENLNLKIKNLDPDTVIYLDGVPLISIYKVRN